MHEMRLCAPCVSDARLTDPLLCCPQVDKLDEAESQRKTEEEVTEPVVTMTEAVSEEEKEPLCLEEVKGGVDTVTREEAIR